jgi:hypothetical protein
VIGLDIQSHDIARAASITDRAATFVLGDMRRATFPRCNVAVFFDTLHYIAIDEQDDVLRRVRMALCPGGVKLLRVGDTSARLRYRFGMWIDRFTRWLARRRIRTPPLAPDFGLDGDACGPGPRRAILLDERPRTVREPAARGPLARRCRSGLRACVADREVIREG